MKEKEELKNLSKWGKFSFYLMIDCEIFTYLKNKKSLIIIANKKFKWNNIYHVLVNGVVWCNPLIFFNPLIIWNSPFGVDVPLTEKPGG